MREDGRKRVREDGRKRLREVRREGVVRRGDLSASEVEGSAEATEAAEAEDFSGLTVKELKAVLRSRGLSVSGRMAELLARLGDAA